MKTVGRSNANIVSNCRYHVVWCLKYRRKVLEWVCEQYCVCHDRDVNAAQNILAAGLVVVPACGGDVRPVHSKGLLAIPAETGKPTRERGNLLLFDAWGGCQLFF